MAERPEDLNLPTAVITRIIKDAIPDGVNVSKEARLAISKAASVFVLYATSCSNNFAMKGKRKTIAAQDVITAMEDMEFDQFVEPLKNCLEAYRKGQQGKKDQKKKSKEQSDSSKDHPEEGGGDAGSDVEVDDNENEAEVEEEEDEDNGEQAVSVADSDVMIISDASSD
ncbi:hypothetical protein CHS0354_014040 [Potamilus streckersoni]|uniref:DNA polymerase epsilon subunit 3 n=1 Tax=Potamilus streckersoni TaxID=2493646 RepID=A0AAE0VJA6_9BIVA|nr:hypothetical protein CHS0354_014040 [Potamilus streckersoni]